MSAKLNTPARFSAALAIGAAALLFAPGAAAQTQDCGTESSLRSSTTGAAVELSFRNAAGDRKRLYWIDYDGERKFYTVVEPGNIYRQQTSSGHAWVVTDDTERCVSLVVAPVTATTIDIGGPVTAQLAPPAPGVQQPIAQAPVVSAPVASAPVQTAPAPVQSPPPAIASAPQQAASEPLPQISPIEQFQLNGPQRVAPRNVAGKLLNNQASGSVEVAGVKPEWDSGQWLFEAVPGTPFVRIKNRWKNTFLTDVNGALRATPALPDADEAHWTFEPVDGTSYVQFRNRDSDRFLLLVNGAPALAADFRQDQEPLSHWQVDSASRAATPVSAQPRSAAYVAYDSALASCRQIGGYWTGSSCRAPQPAVRLACQPGWVWAPDMDECLWDGGGRCPPWQMSPSGACISDLTCRGGRMRISGRGYPVCDCPLGTTAWGNYPNLSCVPSVTRVLPLIVGPGFQGRPQVGQGFGNKKFGQGQWQQGGGRPSFGGPTQVNVNTTGPVGTPAAGGALKPVVTTPVTTPAVTTTTKPPAPSAPCAPWQTGVPGACVDKKVVCVGGRVEQGYCRCSDGFIASGFNDNFTCQPRSTAACPAGSTGTPPNCKPTTATTTTPTACPQGQTGTQPNCRPVVTAPNAPCAPWQTGVPGACVDKKVVCVGGRVEQGHCRCSDGFIASGFNDNFTCQPRSTAACPAGSTGTPPNCKPTTATTTTPTACPQGQTGTFPNCKEVVTAPTTCPPNRAGPPNCRQLVTAPKPCPKGQTGTQPNCKPVVTGPTVTTTNPVVQTGKCPPGFSGTQPNCKPVVTGPTFTTTNPVVQTGKCPPGFSGTQPNCKPVVTGPTVTTTNPVVQTGKCPPSFSGTQPNCKPVVTAPTLTTGNPVLQTAKPNRP
jgi:hypothetical protein